MKTMLIRLALMPLALALSSPMLGLAQEAPAKAGTPSSSALTQAPQGAAGYGTTSPSLQEEQSQLSALHADLEGQLTAMQSGNSPVDLAGLSQKVKSYQQLEAGLGTDARGSENEAATKLLAAIDSANKTAAGSDQRSAAMKAVENGLAQLLGSSGQSSSAVGRSGSPTKSGPKLSNPVKGIDANLNFDGEQSHPGQTPVPAAPAQNAAPAPAAAPQATPKGQTGSALSGGPVHLDKAAPPPPAPESHPAASPAQPAKALPTRITVGNGVEAGVGGTVAVGGSVVGATMIAAAPAAAWDAFATWGMLGGGAALATGGTVIIVAAVVVGAYFITDAALRQWSPSHQGITERIF